MLCPLQLARYRNLQPGGCKIICGAPTTLELKELMRTMRVRNLHDYYNYYGKSLNKEDTFWSETNRIRYINSPDKWDTSFLPTAYHSLLVSRSQVKYLVQYVSKVRGVVQQATNSGTSGDGSMAVEVRSDACKWVGEVALIPRARFYWFLEPYEIRSFI